jgi:hypothetical protein
LDRVTHCSDCGTELVAEADLAAAEVAHDVRPREAPSTDVIEAHGRPAANARVDIWTGAGLLVLSVAWIVLMLVFARRIAFLPVGVFVYGVYRLNRGVDAGKKTRPPPKHPFR